MLQTKKSRRLVFTAIMTIAAPIFGGLQSYRKLRWQDDFWSDMLQVELIIAVGTAIAAFVYWSVLNASRESNFRGGLAGFLTAITILPLPVFGWSFRNDLMPRLADKDTAIIMDVILSAGSSLHYASVIFLSKAIIAVPLSIGVGYFIARQRPQAIPFKTRN